MIDARQFNVCDGEGKLLCPACGFPGYVDGEAYDEAGDMPGSGICPCCLWEPGFDDEPAASAAAQGTILASLQSYRASWRLTMEWRVASCKPEAWDGEQQLARLLTLAPHLRG
jgi:hypothetical protein